MNESGKAGVARVFFALWPDANCANRLHAVAEHLATHFGGRAARADTLHLTLAFVGDVNEDRLADLIELGNEAARESGPSEADNRQPGLLLLDRLAYWKHKRILWAGCDRFPSAPETLAARLTGKLTERGYAASGRSALPKPAFQAHITLVRKVQAVPEACALDVLKNAPISWVYEDFVLLRSRTSSAGSTYERLASWKPRTIDTKNPHDAE